MKHPLIEEATRKLRASMNRTHARITFAAHDMNAFAHLGDITVEQYHAAPEGPQDADAHNSVILDLMQDEDTMRDEKFVTPETAAQLLGWPVEGFIQRGRQAVAQVLDEERAMLRARYRDILWRKTA